MRAGLAKLMLAAAAALSLGACAETYGRAPGYRVAYVDYGGYWGDPFGWQFVPVGWIGPGFGWHGGWYYPGRGGFVYDRRGFRRPWSGREQAWWGPRVRPGPPVVSQRVGGALARRALPPGEVRQRQPGQGWPGRRGGYRRGPSGD